MQRLNMLFVVVMVCVLFTTSCGERPLAAPVSRHSSPRVSRLGRRETRVGAIRWDAYYGPSDETGLAPIKCLSPQHWHYRLPFFAEIINASAVTWQGSTQNVTDTEIAFARRAGLDYWAFVVYDEGTALSLALNNYRTSTQRGNLGFALILEAGRLCGWYGQNETWRAESQRLGEMLTDPLFERVVVPTSSDAEARPLVYLMGVTSSNIDVLKNALPALTAVARAHCGGVEPYYVLINSDNTQAKREQV